MREIQDHYFHKAKKEGYPARSVYKLEEAQQKHKLLQNGDKVLDLGYRPGSWSMYASKMVGPAGLVVGVDINPGKKLHVTNGAKIVSECADIMTEESLKLVRGHCLLYDVVLSDMAPRTTGNKWTDQQQSLALARRVLEIALLMLKPGGNFYCKVFEGEDFRDYVQEVKQHFSTSKVFIPQSSRKESREVFVLAKGFGG